MDTSSPAPIDSVSASATDSPIKRQRRSPELKLKIVEESLAPGASVARMARAHGVNANQVFKWRRQYQQGLLSCGQRRKDATPGLLAVRVTTPHDVAHSPGSAPMPAFPSGTIQIELAKGTIRIRGQADVDVLRTTLEQSPFSGQVFVLRGRRRDLIKVLWFDGDGLWFAKRLERG